MIVPPKPPDEERRLAALHALNLLDTEPEERFDRITRLAQRVFGTSAATFSLIDADRQWFKSEVGAAGKEDPRDISFCAHAILEPDTTVIEDARSDKRFHHHPRPTRGASRTPATTSASTTTPWSPATPTSASTRATRSPDPGERHWARS